MQHEQQHTQTAPPTSVPPPRTASGDLAACGRAPLLPALTLAAGEVGVVAAGTPGGVAVATACSVPGGLRCLGLLLLGQQRQGKLVLLQLDVDDAHVDFGAD